MRITPKWLFDEIANAKRSKILGWWERRRIFFNLYVGLVGVVTWFLVLFAGSAAVKPGVDFEEPLAMVLGPFVYGFMANICYSCGPIIDLIFYRGRPRVNLFKLGLYFSLAFTALPGLWAVFSWLTTVVTGKKIE
jgi:hypothetical protein